MLFVISNHRFRQYRFSTLLQLQADLLTELSLMNSFASENLKSYQVWHHRLTLLTHLNPDLALLKKEISFIHESLIPDTKNYHTWSYLHWIYTRFSSLSEDMGGPRFGEKDWDAEKAWCEAMLDSEGVIGKEEGEEGEDVLVNGDGRNNSAWGWRWYLMVSREGARGKTDVEGEVE
jgi:protein farnesyltransferase/geranylgeranyltransferase type-1 subunit alpha